LVTKHIFTFAGRKRTSREKKKKNRNKGGTATKQLKEKMLQLKKPQGTFAKKNGQAVGGRQGRDRTNKNTNRRRCEVGARSKAQGRGRKSGNVYGKTTNNSEKKRIGPDGGQEMKKVACWQQNKTSKSSWKGERPLRSWTGKDLPNRSLTNRPGETVGWGAFLGKRNASKTSERYGRNEGEDKSQVSIDGHVKHSTRRIVREK